jgi:outer membrane protein assembly factor BamE (lipoprotein component of BamABCDE complex)
MVRHSGLLKKSVAVVFSILCTAIAPKHTASADSTLSVVSRFIDQGFAVYPGNTRTEIHQHFGRPIRTESKRVRNNHYPIFADRIHTLYYDGLAIKVYEAAIPQQEFVVAIWLNSSAYQLIDGLRIGAEKSAVIKILGVPAFETAKLLIYDEMQSGNGRVCFKVENNVVQEILWEYYFD